MFINNLWYVLFNEVLLLINWLVLVRCAPRLVSTTMTSCWLAVDMPRMVSIEETSDLFDVTKRSRRESCLVGSHCSWASPFWSDNPKSFSERLGIGFSGRLLCVSQQMSLQLKLPAKMTVALLLPTSVDTCCSAAYKPSTDPTNAYSKFEMNWVITFPENGQKPWMDAQTDVHHSYVPSLLLRWDN